MLNVFANRGGTKTVTPLSSYTLTNVTIVETGSSCVEKIGKNVHIALSGLVPVDASKPFQISGLPKPDVRSQNILFNSSDGTIVFAYLDTTGILYSVGLAKGCYGEFNYMTSD